MRVIALTLLLLAAVHVSAQEDAFLKAQAAYDDARYAEAAMLYENLLSNGVDNVEVHYNLANACFKNGELPKAVWHYRKAWYGAPHDPDIRANLRFALNAAGAIEPAGGFMKRFFMSRAPGGWIGVAVAGYLLLVLFLSLALFVKPARRLLLKLGLISSMLILLGGAGWWQWKTFFAHPEWVVIKSETTALFGPVKGSTAHYKLPLGALIQQYGTDPKGWIEVEYDGKRGWIEPGFVWRVSP
ncbi:MAG: tetratricopeptide repeat protein [Pontiella sp.]|nr:tetratricopeptide repeat protein [Pontiella sp.]